jgi:hypothetical protein
VRGMATTCSVPSLSSHDGTGTGRLQFVGTLLDRRQGYNQISKPTSTSRFRAAGHKTFTHSSSRRIGPGATPRPHIHQHHPSSPVVSRQWLDVYGGVDERRVREKGRSYFAHVRLTQPLTLGHVFEATLRECDWKNGWRQGRCSLLARFNGPDGVLVTVTFASDRSIAGRLLSASSIVVGK